MSQFIVARPLSLFPVTDAIDSFVLIVLYLLSEKSQSTRWKIIKWEIGGLIMSKQEMVGPGKALHRNRPNLPEP